MRFARGAFTELVITLTADQPLGQLSAQDGTHDAVTLSGPPGARTVLMTPLTRAQWRGYADLSTLPDGPYLVAATATDELGNAGPFSLPFELLTFSGDPHPSRTVRVQAQGRRVVVTLELRRRAVAPEVRRVRVH